MKKLHFLQNEKDFRKFFYFPVRRLTVFYKIFVYKPFSWMYNLHIMKLSY